MKQRKTVGELSLQAAQKPEDTRDPIELQRSMQENYIDELLSCVEANKNKLHGNFFIVVIAKRERLMRNVLRNYFFARLSCPTPDYDQTVFMYNAKDESIEYLWCIPDRETSLTLKQNALAVIPSERQLLKHVLDFSDGTLFRQAKKLNKETEDSIFLQ